MKITKMYFYRFIFDGSRLMVEHFRKKSLFFQDTRDNQEYDAKNRLSIPGPSPEKLMAEVYSFKKKLTLEVVFPKSFQSVPP